MNRKILPWSILLICASLSITAYASSSIMGMTSAVLAHEPLSPTPTYDPLAIPILSDNPTQVELGKHVYYYNCMPCHGDQGQGLTEEWRMVWEEDHRDCWNPGCHGGREMDEGFPIPTIIPAVILDGDALQAYAQPEALFAYLRLTHPPQAPGRLDDDDYHSVVAYLWEANQKTEREALQSTAFATDSVQLTLEPTPAIKGTQTAPVATQDREPTQPGQAFRVPEKLPGWLLPVLGGGVGLSLLALLIMSVYRKRRR